MYLYIVVVGNKSTSDSNDILRKEAARADRVAPLLIKMMVSKYFEVKYLRLIKTRLPPYGIHDPSHPSKEK